MGGCHDKPCTPGLFSFVILMTIITMYVVKSLNLMCVGSLWVVDW